MYGIYWETFFPWFDWENGTGFKNFTDGEYEFMFFDYTF